MKAMIDLDWLEADIENAETKIKVFKEGHVLRHIQEAICGKLHEVRSKCTPIESFLSKTCVNNWESNKYCSKEGECELCKIKQ